VNTAGGNISRLVSNFPNFYFAEVDGTDPVASYAALSHAVAHCRARKGPAFVHGHVIRPYAHSFSDDEKLYRPDDERQKDALRDPITRMQLFLIRENILDEEGINRLEKGVDEEIQRVTDKVLAAPLPTVESITRDVYSEVLNPCSDDFSTQPAVDGNNKTMADLITACLRDEMRRDDRIVIFGEDVADCSRQEYLAQKRVKGKGGVFKLTSGLQ